MTDTDTPTPKKGPLAKALAAAKHWESRYWRECNRRSKAEDDLRALSAQLREARQKLDDELTHNTVLARQVARLEGYQQRVERVDDLDRNIPPMQHGDGGRVPIEIDPHFGRDMSRFRR